MVLSHVIVKVDDLDQAVKEWTDKGYVVEYGKKKKPYNALIYFKEGPYIELFKCCGIPTFAKKIIKVIGNKNFIHRMNFWDQHEPGIIGIEIENEYDDLKLEAQCLRKYGEKFFYMKSHRMDTKGRELRFHCIFPDNMKIPAMMSRFSISPKPTTDNHPNGVKGISSIKMGTGEKEMAIIQELCQDERLQLYIGEGFKNLKMIDSL